MKKLLLISAILCATICKAQSYDSTLWKQVVISKIEHSMRGGAFGEPGYIFSVTSMTNETRYGYFRRMTKNDRENWKNGFCLLIPMAKWEDLLKNKL